MCNPPELLKTGVYTPVTLLKTGEISHIITAEEKGCNKYYSKHWGKGRAHQRYLTL